MENHYYTTKLVKMGKWALWPADVDAWFSEGVSYYFKKAFGITKGLLIILTLDDGYEHAYLPVSYFQKLYKRIDTINSKDYKGLERILSNFYSLKSDIRAKAVKLHSVDLNKLSNMELLKLYVSNRDLVHQATIYDQFGWLAEEYWKSIMDDVIVNKLKIKKDSDEYHRVLFALTVPEEISTTLEEKRAVLKSSIGVKKNQKLLPTESSKLAKEFGWMPVFAYGNAWDAKHYAEELSVNCKKDLSFLEGEYSVLEQYTVLRKKNIDGIVQKYKLDERDLQHFIDFGLALDGRNEAEYLVSFLGFFLVPTYQEIARRLNISVHDLRRLYEKEIEECLSGNIDAVKLLDTKRDIVAYGYDSEMTKRTDYSTPEARKLFKYVESTVKSVQGNNELKGVCASRGKVSGKARVLASPMENYKVNDGDVLITHATTVDYLPAMKKAAAIVTEVGGLTCHAAVVSREFGIPCVVALKNAMKNFKDGEMIEVDADEGLVRKI